MKVRVTFSFNEVERRAINARHGLPYPAEHSEIKEWLEAIVQADLKTVVDDYEKKQ